MRSQSFLSRAIVRLLKMIKPLYKLPMLVVESVKAMSWVVVYGVVLEGISARP